MRGEVIKDPFSDDPQRKGKKSVGIPRKWGRGVGLDLKSELSIQKRKKKYLGQWPLR